MGDLIVPQGFKWALESKRGYQDIDINLVFVCRRRNWKVSDTVPANKDLTGQRFGRLEVIARLGSRPVGRSIKTFYRCRCDCGKVVEIAGNHLVSSLTKSCGCLAQGTKSYIAWRNKFCLIERLDELIPTYKQRRYYWLLECRNCGHRFKSDLSSIKSGRKGCPACRKPRGRRRWLNLAGKTINHIRVIREAGTKNGSIIWEAQCLFGAAGCKGRFLISSIALVHGHQQSCGCKKWHDRRVRALQRLKEFSDNA